MTRVPMAVLLRGFAGAWLLAAFAGCAASAPKATAPTTAVPPASPATRGSVSASPFSAPGTNASPVADSSTPAMGPATAAEPVASGPLAPLPVPAAPPPAPGAPPRVLLADELPYIPAHLRAHDAKAERHHPRDREAAAARGSSGTAEALPDHDRSSRRPYHPAPGIVVDVVAANGGGSAPDLQRAARTLGYWPFRQCYEEGLRRDPRLAGKVSLELAINPGGDVDRSVVTTTSEHDEIVAACVAREAQHLALPASGSPTTAKVDVSLAIGDEPVPAGHPIPTAETVREALRASWDAVRRCYATALTRHPGVGGRMELHFRTRHGEIEKVDEIGGAGENARFGDVDVTRCVIGIYRAARLPASAHGAHERSFVYALQFESTPVDGATP